MDGSLERAVLVYTTFPSIGEAEQAGQALVERRLCACVNILPGMVSLYWWHGAIDRGDEVVMLIKTRASLAEPVRAAVQEAAFLYDAGISGDSARERRSGLSRLDRGGDARGAGGARGAIAVGVRGRINCRPFPPRAGMSGQHRNMRT